MASRYNPRLFNAAMAAFAGGSVAFAIFAMPADIFSLIVRESGLPAFVDAARPPLGETARFAAIAGGAALTFALVWLLLSAFDRVGKAGSQADTAASLPRVRRADAHPDAPMRRPIFAAKDFGAPLDELPLDDFGFDEPLTLDQLAGDPEPKVAPEPQPKLAVEPNLQPQPEAEAKPEREPSAAGFPSFLLPEQPEPAPAEREDVSTEALLLRLPAPEKVSESVPDLMQRLNAGLSEEIPTQAGGSEQQSRGSDSLLRSVLDDLEKMARRA